MVVSVTTHTILNGDVRDCLRTLPDNSVQCVVTSPPYYGLRNYGVEGQIGLEETPEQFVAVMVEVFREVRRVLREDGTLWLNFGDSYSGSGCGSNDHREDGASISKNDQKYQGQRPGIITGLKPKDMIGIPWRVAFALQADGWYLRSDIIWAKRNCMPESVTDRPTKAHEYIFLLTKSPKYFYDADAIREPASKSYQNDSRPANILRQRVNKHSKYPNEGQFKKQDLTGNPTYKGFNERYRKGIQDFRAHRRPNGKEINRAKGIPDPDYLTRNKRTVWWINPQPRPDLHFATFPDELAETCIKAGTSEYGCCPECGAPYQRIVEAKGGKIGGSWHPHENDGVTGQKGFKDDGTYRREFKGWQPSCKCKDAGEPVPCVVLDPFMGSGTVAVIARDLNRSSIGIELNPEYVKIIKKRLQAHEQLDTGAVRYEFRKVSA